MAESDNNENVIPIKALPSPNAARQRRYRQRKRNAPDVSSITPRAAKAVTPAAAAPVTHPSHFLNALALTAAISLAVVSAYFSISGMTAIFPGAIVPVIAMAAAMEGGKLAGAAWLARHWRVTSGLLRAVLVALVASLAIINATGVFSQLTAAHLSPHVTTTAAIEKQAVEIEARSDSQMHVVADLDRRIGQIDLAIEEAAKRGRSRSALTLADEQRRNRDTLVTQRQHEAGELVRLKAERGQVTAQSRLAEADVGPLQFAATLAGLDREQALRLLILFMVLTCDPLSIVLIIAVAGVRSKGVRSEL